MSETENQTPEGSKDVGFSLSPVTVKPKRKYRKGSKYDPMLEAFLKGTEKLVAVTVAGKSANYMRTQVSKRIEAVKKFSKIEASVVNNKLYLEKK